MRVYRLAGGETKWLYNERVDQYELYGGGADDEPIATFDDPAEIDDPAAYPATERDIETGDADADALAEITAPFIPRAGFSRR